MSDLEYAITNLNTHGYDVLFQRINGAPESESDIILIDEQGRQERLATYQELLDRGN